MTGANDPPLLAPIGNKTVANGGTLSFTLAGSDPNGNALTYEAFFLPSGAIFDANTRTFTWTPSTARCNNVFTGITFRVVDNGVPNLSDSETINITIAHRAGPGDRRDRRPNGHCGSGLAVHSDRDRQQRRADDHPDLGSPTVGRRLPFVARHHAGQSASSHVDPVGRTGRLVHRHLRAEDNGNPILNSTRSLTINVVANRAPITVQWHTVSH